MTAVYLSHYREFMNESMRDPRKEILELGSRIGVEVRDGDRIRTVSVNVFDPAAPPFPEASPVSQVCNSIKKEALERQPLPQTPAIATPTRTPEPVKGIETPAQDRGQITR